jgi:hypothetical protein
MRKLLFFSVLGTALALASSTAGESPARADPREEARVRQTVLSIPTNIDMRNFDAVEPLFADPVVIDYTSLWGGEPSRMSPGELMTAWRGIVPGFDATWHEITNLKVQVTGDTAKASSNVDGRHWLGEQVWRPIGRYDFRLARQDGRWRVTHMTLTVTREEGDRALVDQARARAAAR